MSYKTYRLRQKAGTGYDIFHIETSTDLVLRFNKDGTMKGTLEDSMSSLEEAFDTHQTNVAKLLDQAFTAVSDETKRGNILTIGDGALVPMEYNADNFAPTEHTHTLDKLVGNEADRVVVTGADKIPVESTVTTAELQALTGISTSATIQSQLDGKAASNHEHTQYVGTAAMGSTIPLMTSGKIDAQYLPSFVDDIMEGVLTNSTTFTIAGAAATPEAGKIYVDTNTNKTYRWSGTVYVEVGGGVSLGETSATAYRGDLGKVAYTHSQAAHARTDATATAKSTTNGNVLINGAQVVVYTHPTYAGTKGTNTANPGFGGTFVAISAVTLGNGHVSGYTATTVTMPARPVNISFSATQPTNQTTNDLWFKQL